MLRNHGQVAAVQITKCSVCSLQGRNALMQARSSRRDLNHKADLHAAYCQLDHFEIWEREVRRVCFNANC